VYDPRMLFKVHILDDPNDYEVVADEIPQIGTLWSFGGKETIITSHIWYAKSPDDRHPSGWIVATKIISKTSK
jgi:hypothetical protein